MIYKSYIATTSDGFVATKDNDLSFLDNYQDIVMGQYSYDKFLDTVDTVIMGLSTYRFIEKLNINPYEGKKVYVLATDLEPLDWFKVISGTPQELNTIFEKDGCESVWVMGGPNVHQQFIDAGLLKEAQVFVVPEELGEGIPLFKEKPLPKLVIEMARNTRFEIYEF